MQQTEPLTDLQMQILTALVEGYRAREGMKDRIRALNEWEIARRTGVTEVSYAEFFEHPTRDKVLNALLALQRRGLAEVWERGVKYDTFVPTATADGYLTGGRDVAVEELMAPVSIEPGAPAPSPDPVVERLDEVIRLLRSIDAKLGGS